MKTKIIVVSRETGAPLSGVVLTYLDTVSATNQSGEAFMDLPPALLALSVKYGLLFASVAVMPKAGETLVVRI